MINYSKNQNAKQAILSLMGGLGLIILFIGIFLDVLPFTQALFISITLWILTGVVSSFFGFNRHGKLTNTNWRNAMVSLVGGIGVIILLSGIFLDVPFNYALVTAISLWILSGVLASFLGVSNQQHRKKEKYFQVPYSSGLQTNEQISNSKFGEISEKAKINSQLSGSKYCNNCGSSMAEQDTFCSNCGSSNSAI